MKIPAAALAVAFAPCLARAFSFDDIHFWVGEGTNRMAVVIDWNVPDEPSSLAWGYRWNGDAPAMARAIAEIAREDPRLHYASSLSSYGTSVDGFGYDLADAAVAFDPASGTASAPGVLVGAYVAPCYWAQSHGTGTAFSAVQWTDGNGVDADHVPDGGWYCFKHTNWMTGESSKPVVEPVPAESPYAWRAVDSFLQPEEDLSYWWNGIYYPNVTRHDAAAALGRPSLHVSGYADVPDHPATPADQAWNDDQVVKLVAPDDAGDDACGYVTVEFDHDVADDPRNPFGLDFIVFSYRFVYVSGGYYATQDPASIAPQTDRFYAPRGRVEASADGTAWVVVGEIGSESFAPGLSHVYDPSSPDPRLWESEAYENLWWGAPTDATRPFDPSIRLGDFDGATLARMCELYDGSAGGTGFDIGGLALPRDALGRKFVRFVRISALDPGDEISVDAVSDVAPAPSFRRWVDENFAFKDRPGVTAATICANGAPASVNAAFGRAPNGPAPTAWSIEGFDPATRTLVSPFAPDASDLVRLRSSAKLANANWSSSVPLWAGTNALGRPLLRAQTPEAAAEFFRLEIHE